MSNQITTQTLSFHGSDLITLKVEDVIYTAVKPIVEAMGLDWGGQQQKLSKSGDKFNCRDISMVAKDGKIRQMLCMPLKKLNGWLFSINPEKVRADLREKVIQYQEECFLALWDYWTEGIARRDEVKNKMALWEQKKAEYTQRATERGKLLQQCKSEKQALNQEFLQIKQLDLFVNL